MSAEWYLPMIFAGLMALAMLLYVILDGYDLGVGILLPFADDQERDQMIASIGPFWDANETWLVLGIGILLIAFPKAHGVILTALYLPVFFMLFGLILRGVAFDFRYKAKSAYKNLWDNLFFAGSLIASLAQGFMLGRYIMGFEGGWNGNLFATLTAICTAAGYGLLGSTWLAMKTDGNTLRKTIRWANRCLGLTVLGVVAVSVTTPLVSEEIFAKWFSFPTLFWLSPIPLVTAVLVLQCFHTLNRDNIARLWQPFACSVGIFVLSFSGLAYSLFPHLVRGELDIWQAASATESLQVTLWGALITVPAILLYTMFS
ncbi:MAG: cytochrome d ubiquinol oxidase subunit II, partial [Pseudomonadota bacterium]